MSEKSKKGIGIRGLAVIATALLVAVSVLITLVILQANGAFYDEPERDAIIPPKTVGTTLSESVYKYRLLDDGGAMITLFEGEETEVLEIPTHVGGHKVTAIGPSAYSIINTVVREIRIPEGVTYIGKGAFTGMENVSLYLPQSIEQIDDMALYGFDNPAGIYYAGTEAQWENVKVGTDNKVLANIIFDK